MSKFHGLDCVCCKDKIPGVEKILEEVSRIFGPTGLTETEKTLEDFKNLSSTTFSGQVDDVAAIATEFLSAPLESLDVDQLKLEDPNKKVGQFLVKDLCDVPTLDVTKVIDLSKFDIGNLASLKFSISVPTIEVTKSITFPFLSVKIRFLLNRKGFAFFPVLDNGVTNRQQALEKLKGIKSLQPISSKTDFNIAKSLAVKGYPTSKEVYQAVADSSNTVDLMNNLGKIGVVLQEEVDVSLQVKAIIDNETNSKKAPVYDDPDCGATPLVLAPFDMDALKAVERDCCSQDLPPAISTSQSAQLDDAAIIEKQIQDLNVSNEADPQDLVDLQNFITDVNNSNNIMQSCAKELQNATNNYYWYLEANFLNDIALEYVSARSKMMDSLNGTFTTLEAERTRLLQLSSALKDQENSLTTNAYKRIYSTTTSTTSTSTAASTVTPTYVLKLDSVSLTQEQLTNINNDVTFSTAISTVRSQFQENETAIQKISSQIEDQKKLFALPTYTVKEAQNFLTLGVDATFSGSVLANQTKVFKDQFSINTNPISNQIGFTASQVLNLCIHSAIVDEAKTLFELTSPEKGDVSDYVQKMSTRTGVVATQLWDKFYSANQIDNLFTYQEQGFTTPKPQFDSNGHPIGDTDTVNMTDLLGNNSNQAVSKDALNLKIDKKVSQEFWSNLYSKTRDKVILLLNSIKSSPDYVSYITSVKAAGENEAKKAFAANTVFQSSTFSNRSFNSYTNSFSISQSIINNTLSIKKITTDFVNQYKMVYDSIAGFHTSIQNKLKDIDSFIESKKKCIADQEKTIADRANSYAKMSARGNSANSALASPIREDCASLLGSDPNGMKLPHGCPGIEKNCYWEEYTSLMQQVSIMPIPDDISMGMLTKRLFRYYPVGLQIPVPVPAPVVLPTLAMGIPDPMISIPMPLIWKHIITITTPIGMFVIWIAICGPVPGPYIMYVDEKVDPCFLVTPKGPISIPAKSLGITQIEDLSLLDLLSPIKDTFRVDLSIPSFSSLQGGNGKIKTGDPDDPSSVIDKLQEKIKAASDSLQASDPWTIRITGASASNTLRDRVKKALRNYPPDIEAVQEALKKIEDSIDSHVDAMNISSIKFPKNQKSLIFPITGASEFIDSLNKLLDAGLPPHDLGLGAPTISLRAKLKKLIDEELDSPEVKADFYDINVENANQEASMNVSAMTDNEKIKARAAKLKKSIKTAVSKVADKITPENLGFVSMCIPPIPLPFPCYGSITVEPVPPYILTMMAVIKTLPDAIDGISDQDFALSISAFIDLKAPLPSMEDCIFFTTQSFLQYVPDLSFPDVSSATLFKLNMKTVVQNFFKIKLRMPHPGVPQISIPSSMVKDAIKTATKAAFGVVVSTILGELTLAATNGDFVKVLAVAAIIKATFGTDLGDISGNDVKAFVSSSLDSINQYLDTIKPLLTPPPKLDFKSIKETLFPTIPPKITFNEQKIEIATQALIDATYPIIQTLESIPLPYPVILLAASQAPSRLVITKTYPYAAKEVLPTWEKLSLNNIPFVIWLDQLIATAQKQGGLVSDYVIPYYLPDV